MATLSVTLPTPTPPVEHTAAGRPTANPRGRHGRPFFTDTKLGALIDARGMKVKDVVNGAGMNPRVMSDYLSRRKPISAPNALALATFLGVRIDDIMEDA